MYLLFLDESGTHGGSPIFILGGIAIHEQDAWRMQRRLHSVIARKLPVGMDPLDFELHASEMVNPARWGKAKSRPGKKVVSPWSRVNHRLRMSILDDAYKTIGTHVARDAAHPIALLGSVVERGYARAEEHAYEQLLHRFDSLLNRQGYKAKVDPHDRGIVIHDKRSIERDVQAWTHQWRQVAGTMGQLTHLADVPFFADSRASRLIQCADLVTWALWRYYGLTTTDAKYISGLWPVFDGDDGTMHGLIHLTPDFKKKGCGCPPCASRLWSGGVPPV